MADIDSSQPVYSRASSAPVIVSKDTSANATSNPVYVQLSDGTSALSITSGALDVNVDNTVTVSATDLDIRDLTNASDSVAIGDASNIISVLTINSAFGATPNVFGVAGKYEATPTTYDDGDAVPLLTDAEGRLQVDVISGGGSNASVLVDDSAFTVASDSVTVAGFLADETTPDSVDEGDTGAARMTLDRKQLMVIADPTTDANRLAIAADGSIEVQNDTLAVVGGGVEATALRVTIASDSTGLLSVDDNGGSLTVDNPTHDDFNVNANIQVGDTDVSASNPVPISADGNANGETNPLYVQVVSGALSGIEVVDYDTASAVASDATDNHDYAVAASNTLKVQCCLGSASGEQKIEILSGPVAGLSSQAVQFTSSSNPNWFVDFKGLLEVDDASTGTLRIARTNRENQAMDVYSTIIGTLIAD